MVIEKGCELHGQHVAITATFLSTHVATIAHDADARSCDARTMNRIKELREAAGLSQEALAFQIGTDKTTISRLENGSRKLTQERMFAIAQALGCSPADLIAARGQEGLPSKPFAQPPAAHLSASKPSGIAEIDVRAGLGLGGEALSEYRPDGNGGVVLGDAVRGHWHLPDDYLRVELRATANDLTIIEVEGDSMAPTLQTGDRVMVNLRARIPSPPGIFALWDGLGVVCKRVEHIQGSDPPLLKIISDNERHSAYERTIEEAHIIGRVVWFARRM